MQRASARTACISIREPLNTRSPLRAERELRGGAGGAVACGRQLEGPRKVRCGKRTVPAIDHAFEPNATWGERGHQVGHVTDRERAGHNRIVRDQNKVFRQDRLEARQAAMHINSSDIILIKGSEQSEQSTGRFRRFWERVIVIARNLEIG